MTGDSSLDSMFDQLKKVTDDITKSPSKPKEPPFNRLKPEDQDKITALIQTAMDAGAVEALYIDAKDVVVDDRVRIKCLVPLCRHYGDLVCPPNVPTPDEFRKFLRLYRYAVILSTEYINPPKPSSLEDSEEVSKEIRKKSYDLSEILLKMEAVALQKGYRFAAGFTGGSCHYCDSCVKTGKECKTPYRARPSMEAVGVDVVETLKKVDMTLEFPVDNKVKWWGLLLAD
jgi:predicted metal-binding protein